MKSRQYSVRSPEQADMLDIILDEGDVFSVEIGKRGNSYVMYVNINGVTYLRMLTRTPIIPLVEAGSSL